MARPIWSGTISFGLVAIPVKLFSAVRKQSVSFNQLDGRTMARIRYKKVSDLDGEPVPDGEIVKGYEVSKGHYVVVDPDELEPFMPVPTKTIDLDEFVDLEEIDPVLFDAAYLVAPSTNPKPYVLLTTAMEEANKVGIGRFVMRNKQYSAALRADNGKLVMSTLVYADELVDPDSIPELEELASVEVNRAELAMAETLVDSLTAAFDPAKYVDEYREQVLALIDQKAAGEELVAVDAPSDRPNVVDLMAALEASVNAAKQARADAAASQADVSASSVLTGSANQRPAEEQPTKTRPAKKEPAKKDPAKKEPAGKQPAKGASAKNDSANSAPAKDEPVEGRPAAKRKRSA